MQILLYEAKFLGNSASLCVLVQLHVIELVHLSCYVPISTTFLTLMSCLNKILQNQNQTIFLFIVNDNTSATMPDYVTRNVSCVILDLDLDLPILIRTLSDHSESWLVATVTPLPTTGAATLSVAGSGMFSWFSIQLMSSNLAS